MAVISTRCPSCGGEMQLENSQLVCPYCHTSVLRIVDAKIDGDVTVMSATEFAEKIEATKKQFVINIKDNLQVFDVDTMVINKKIKDAGQALANGNFAHVEECLKGVPANILSAERLRYLAEFHVRNEYELSTHKGYVDNARYRKILSLADEQTKKTYERIAAFCREQHDERTAMEKEVTEADKLLSVQLFDEAEIYAKEMCRKYPQSMLSWIYLYKAKKAKDETYLGGKEYDMMRQCYDFEWYSVPERIREVIHEIANLEQDRVKQRKSVRSFSFVLFGTFLLGIVFLLIAIVGSTLESVNEILKYSSYLLVVIFGLLVFGSLINAGCWFYTYCETEKKYVALKTRYEEKEVKKGKNALITFLCTLLACGCLIGGMVKYISFRFHPEADGFRYEQYLGGYKLVSVDSDEKIVKVPQSFWRTKIGYIASDAFSNCENLEILILSEEIDWIFRETFSNCRNQITVFSEWEYDKKRYENSWLDKSATVYFKGEWEYVDGVPTPTVQK